VPGGKGHHVRVADHRHALGFEGRECLADRKTRLGKMALDAAAAALRHLMLGECGQEFCRGPSFLV
jgi:hypothetical protein